MWAGFLLGWAVAGPRGDGSFGRAVVTMSLWLVIPLLANRLVSANVGPAAASATAVALPVVMLAFALHHPYSSRAKLRLVEGLLLWCRFLLVLSAGIVAAKLYGAGFSIAKLEGGGRWLATGCAAFLVGAAVEWWLARCRRDGASGDRT